MSSTKDGEGMQIEEQILLVIEYAFGFDKERIYPEANLEDDLGLDSLDIVELLLELEDEFLIGISDEDTKKWKTVKDIIDYIKKEKSNE